MTINLYLFSDEQKAEFIADTAREWDLTIDEAADISIYNNFSWADVAMFMVKGKRIPLWWRFIMYYAKKSGGSPFWGFTIFLIHVAGVAGILYLIFGDI